MPTAAPAPDTEEERLSRLRGLLVLDSPPEALFDSLARLASEVCGTPIALLSLVDRERQWFKANVGLPGVNETPRDVAFCAHAIAADALFEVPDARLDARFADHPLVTSHPDIRFYAGAPLTLEDGVRIGTLCVIDRQPRRLDAAQAQMLQRLAHIAVEALVLRRELIVRALSTRSDYERALADSEARHRALVEAQQELVSLARPDGEMVYVNPAYARHFGRTPAQLIGRNLFDLVEPADRAPLRLRLARVLDSGAAEASENRNLAADGSPRWTAWTNTLLRGPDGERLLHSVGRDVTERKRAELALRASEAFLERTGRVAGVGGWELDIDSGRVTWSAETRRIHEVDDGFVPTLESAIGFYAPAARPLIEAAARKGMAGGGGWDLELPLVTATGRPIWVRAVGEAEFEAGRAVRLVGAFQDISERKALQQRLAEGERFLRDITDNLPVRIAYIDHERRYRFVNRLHCLRFDRPREQILGRTRSELLGALNSPVVEAHIDAVLAGAAQVFEFDERVGGQIRTVESRLAPDIGDDGRVRGFFSTSFDITDRAAAQRQLQQQSATLRSITEAVPAVVAVVGADLRYRFVNSAFERWRGQPREQIVGRSLAEVLGEADLQRTRPWAERALAGETVAFERAYPGRGSAAHLAVTYVPLRLDDGRIDGFVDIAQDITPHRLEQVRLLELSQCDLLTGLLNRAGFEARLAQELEAGGGPTLGLLYVDLDHFKPVNDRHGHAVGDQVLQAFATRLVKLVRPSDAVARLGGDEFALLLPGVRELTDAQTVADKVLAAAHAPFEIGSLALQIGASVGVALGADPGAGGRDLLTRADALLYQAKEQGRGRQAAAPR